jgi:hypothetical protein
MNSIVRLVVLVGLAAGAWWWAQPAAEVPVAPASAALRAGATASPATVGTSAAIPLPGQRPVDAPAAGASDAVQRAFDERASSRQLVASGEVLRLLADDRDGSPHQRFIIETDSGMSLLVAHNIALAPRLDGLRAGDRVVVFGEYEWNNQGGVMHWTHDDPQGRHVAGYIEWRGRRYQ